MPKMQTFDYEFFVDLIYLIQHISYNFLLNLTVFFYADR